MNIKNELSIITTSYIMCAYLYMSTAVFYHKTDTMDGNRNWTLIGTILIEVRNLTTFLATTTLTLNNVRKGDFVDYYDDNRLKMK